MLVCITVNADTARQEEQKKKHHHDVKLDEQEEQARSSSYDVLRIYDAESSLTAIHTSSACCTRRIFLEIEAVVCAMLASSLSSAVLASNLGEGCAAG